MTSQHIDVVVEAAGKGDAHQGGHHRSRGLELESRLKGAGVGKLERTLRDALGLPVGVHGKIAGRADQ